MGNLTVRALALVAALGLSFSTANADVEWSGTYRMEGLFVGNPEVVSKSQQKTYGLHHLMLTPKWIMGDGLTVHSRFDIFNTGMYPNSVMGQVWGHGIDVSNSASSVDNPAPDVSRTLSRSQKAEDLNINLLYLTYDQEFGSLIVGRAPLHFGLGMNMNAGFGAFDHWIENRDLVGYKIVMGNMYILPMYAKIHEGAVGGDADDISELIVQFQYANPDSGFELSGFYMDRTAGSRAAAADFANDYPFGTGVIPGSAFTTKQYGVFIQQDGETMRTAVEVGFVNGSSSLKDSNDRKINIEAFGVATELDWKPQGSSWQFGGKMGYATGDDPKTSNYEGYIFNRNYDVAFLLFNHPLGKVDLLRTGAIQGHPQAETNKSTNKLGAVDAMDTDAVSNVMYLSPYVKYIWNDRWSLDGVLTAGMLNQDYTLNTSNNKTLGFEFDFSIQFRPNERVTWINQVGVLLPGSAFEAGPGSTNTNLVYGFTSKAAISF